MSKVIRVNLASIESKDTFAYVAACCNFCEKKSTLKESVYKNIIRLGHGHYYCSFCLRNHFNHKRKKDILLMDFRGIIGFYINYLYVEGSIWRSQILDYIKKHSYIGLQSPVFFYDYETLTWFVDFNKVGNTMHKIPVESVLQTTKAIIDSFDIDSNLKNCNVDKLFEKYEEAVEEFYKNRKRPEGKRILSPTLKNCAYRANADWDDTKLFEIENKLDVFESYYVDSYSEFNELLDTEIQQEMPVVVKRKKTKGEYVGWEGFVNFPGMSKSKIVSTDGVSLFETRKAVMTLAGRLAKKLNMQAKITVVDSNRSGKEHVKA